MFRVCRVLLFLCGFSAASGCAPYNKTGTTYEDANLTVIEKITSEAACCAAGSDYNTKAAEMNKTLGKIAVWWRDEALCLVKASGKKPIPKLHTASLVIAPLPNKPLPLYMLSKEMSTDRGAVCLDGSPPGVLHLM